MRVPGKALRPHRPLAYADGFEIGKIEFAGIASRDDIRHEKSHHFAPDNMLLAKAVLPLSQTEIEVGFPDLRIAFLVLPDRLRIVIILQCIGCIPLGTTHYPKARSPGQVAAHIEFKARPQLRPVGITRVGISRAHFAIATGANIAGEGALAVLHGRARGCGVLVQMRIGSRRTNRRGPGHGPGSDRCHGQ